MAQATAIAHPSVWLDLRGQFLHVSPPGTEDGRGYLPPAVKLGDDPRDGTSPVLFYRHDLDQRGRPPVAPSPGILVAFSRLSLIPAERFPEAVTTFAAKYGTLGICRHGKPSGHGPCMPLQDYSLVASERARQGANVFTVTGWLWFEPLEAWRRYSQQVRAMLGVIARLQVGQPGRAADWRAISDGDPPPMPIAGQPGQKFSLSEWDLTRPDFLYAQPDLHHSSDRAVPEATRLRLDRSLICEAIHTWLRYGGVELRADWWPEDTDYARLHYRVSGLRGVLAVQLGAAVQGPVYVCNGCANPFPLERKKRPPANKRKWCEACGRGEQFRAASRRRYRRKKLDRETPS
jgi:hypothetical protein